MVSVNSVMDNTQAFLEDRESLDDLDKVMRSYMETPEQYRRENSMELFAGMVRIIFSYETIREFYYLMSALYRTTMLEDAYHELIRCIIEDNSLSKETKNYAYWQLANEIFINPSLNNSDSFELLDNLYEDIYQGYLEEFGNIAKIPMESRNEDLVIVITSQVLSIKHGPTKTLLDRCYVLEKAMGKNVFIINTADVFSLNGAINWLSPGVARYEDELSEKNHLEYKGCKFAYYQCPLGMPDIKIMREILSIIFEERPWFVLSIGGPNLTADLCACAMPVLTVSLSSGRTQTRTTFQTITQEIGDYDRLWLSKHGLKENHIINGLFTFCFREQVNKYTRSDLGIPIGETVCLIVGWRLDEEIDDKFMEVISKISENGIYLAFVGNFEKYDNLIERNETLKRHVIKLGLQEDVLAVYECCDIYVNPKRSGGGTSAAEAMFKGLPTVTLRYGDVASAAGDEFCVDDYNEMTERIKKLASDENYYRVMCTKAKQRAQVLIDSETEFVRIIHEMESREGFW